MKYQLRYDGRKLRSFFDNKVNRKPNFDEGLNWCMKDPDCFALVRVGYLGSGWMWIAVKKLSADERRMLETMKDSDNFNPNPETKSKGFLGRMKDIFS